MFSINFFLNAKQLFEYSFIRYLLIGTASLVVDFGIFNILVVIADLPPLHANLISSFITVFFNFTLSNFWTFRATGRGKLRKFSKFLTITVFNYVVSNFLMHVFIEYTEIDHNLAKLFITCLVVCWNFLLYKLWVFKE